MDMVDIFNRCALLDTIRLPTQDEVDVMRAGWSRIVHEKFGPLVFAAHVQGVLIWVSQVPPLVFAAYAQGGLIWVNLHSPLGGTVRSSPRLAAAADPRSPPVPVLDRGYQNKEKRASVSGPKVSHPPKTAISHPDSEEGPDSSPSRTSARLQDSYTSPGKKQQPAPAKAAHSSAKAASTASTKKPLATLAKKPAVKLPDRGVLKQQKWSGPGQGVTRMVCLHTLSCLDLLRGTLWERERPG